MDGSDAPDLLPKKTSSLRCRMTKQVVFSIQDLEKRSIASKNPGATLLTWISIPVEPVSGWRPRTRRSKCTICGCNACNSSIVLMKVRCLKYLSIPMDHTWFRPRKMEASKSLIYSRPGRFMMLWVIKVESMPWNSIPKVKIRRKVF